MGRRLRTSNRTSAPQEQPLPPDQPMDKIVYTASVGDRVTLPDSTTVATTYEGRTVTVTDQAGKSPHLTDAWAARRLDEPDASSTLRAWAPQDFLSLHVLADHGAADSASVSVLRYDGITSDRTSGTSNDARTFHRPGDGHNQWRGASSYNGKAFVDTYDQERATHFE